MEKMLVGEATLLSARTQLGFWWFGEIGCSMENKVMEDGWMLLPGVAGASKMRVICRMANFFI